MSTSIDIEILKHQAEQGDAKAQYELGQCYNFANGIENDDDKAEYWYKKAIEQGYIDAYMALADLYDLDIEHRSAEVIALQKVAAEQGNAEAISALVTYHDLGYYIEPDLEKVFYLYKTTVDNDHNPYCTYRLGQLYENGQGTPRNIDKALECYKTSANKGSAYGLCALALCYLEGKGVPKDNAKALKIINSISDIGNDDIQQKIIGYKALLKYNNDPTAKRALINYYEKGRYIEPDLENIYALYQHNEKKVFHTLLTQAKPLCPQKGNPANQFALAQCYRLGRGVKENEKQTIYWLKCAANNGSEEAQKMLEMTYPSSQNKVLRPSFITQMVELYTASPLFVKIFVIFSILFPLVVFGFVLKYLVVL